MRRSLPFLVLLLAGTAGCGARHNPDNGFGSSQPASEPRQALTADAPSPQAVAPGAMEGRAASGPNVSPTAAPGVAFNYNYSFALAAVRVAELQELHAAMCERLTVNRCRITGMNYQVLGPDDIRARLELKLDPAVARLFGRQATDAVLHADGMLTESQISGVDVGSRIQQAGRDINQLQADLARITAQLANTNLDPGERSGLEEQAQQLREQIRGVQQVRTENEESLATTPMVFNYGSGDLVPGYQPPQSLGESLAKAGHDLMTGGLAILTFLIRAAPWLLLLAILGGLALYARRKWAPRRAVAAAVDEPVTGTDA